MALLWRVSTMPVLRLLRLLKGKYCACVAAVAAVVAEGVCPRTLAQKAALISYYPFSYPPHVSASLFPDTRRKLAADQILLQCTYTTLL
jgi:hypothetical protein